MPPCQVMVLGRKPDLEAVQLIFYFVRYLVFSLWISGETAADLETDPKAFPGGQSEASIGSAEVDLLIQLPACI